MTAHPQCSEVRCFHSSLRALSGSEGVTVEVVTGDTKKNPESAGGTSLMGIKVVNLAVLLIISQLFFLKIIFKIISELSLLIVS